MRNRWIISAVALSMATVAAPAAEEETNELIELRKTVRLQEQQLKGINKKLDQLAATQKPEPKPSWADSLKLKGDLRYRYEYEDQEGSKNKDRHRIRARLGAYADVNDEVKAGIQLATGSSDGATSTNDDLAGYADQKDLWVDLAYIHYAPAQIEGLSATFGKMKKSWEEVSDLMMDSDVNPEGIAANYALKRDGFTLDNQLGYHVMALNSSVTTESQISGQSVASISPSDKIKLSAGGGMFYWDGNTGNDYTLLNLISALDIKSTPLPVKLYAEYILNCSSNVEEDTAWLVGMGTKIGRVKLDYTFRVVEAEAIFAGLAEGDFGSLDYEGHRIKAVVNLMKNFDLGGTIIVKDGKNGVSDKIVSQLDLMVKF
jgi:hypothetical protein